MMPSQQLLELIALITMLGHEERLSIVTTSTQ